GIPWPFFGWRDRRADCPRAGRPRERAKGIAQSVSGSGKSRRSALCLRQVRPKPEYGDQFRISERANPTDACFGDSEHADAVRLVTALGVAGVDHRGRLPVGAGRHHAPVTWRSQELIAQEWNARPAALEPGAQRSRLESGVLEQ